MSNPAIEVYGKKNPNLPFHPAVRAGDYVYVSGQVSKDANGNMVAGTIEEETRATLETVKRVLGRRVASCPTWSRSQPISRTVAISDATTACSRNISLTAASHARPSRRGR